MITNIARKGAFGALLAVAALPLAACGSKEEAASDTAAASGEEKSVEEVQREAAKLERPRPGSYTQTVEIIDMQMPGLPDEAAAQIGAMKGKVETKTICITDEDAEQSYKDMFRNIGQGKDCSYEKFDVSGGRLDARMRCSTQGQGDAAIAMNGTVSETGSDVTVAMDITGMQSPMGGMKMKMHMTTERTGDCSS